MKNVIFKLLGVLFLTVGAFNLYCGVWGAMWHEPDYAPYLGYLQWYVLRPMLIITGLIGLPLGVWLLIPAIWRFMLGNLWDYNLEEEWYDRHYYDQLDDETKRYCRKSTIWNRPKRMIQSIWDARMCFIGRHPEDMVYYCPGGEEGPRGTTCTSCGCGIRLTTSEPDISLPDRGPQPGETVLWDSAVRPDPFRPFPEEEDRQ